MNVANYPITVHQGATYTLALTWRVDGNPVDLTDWSARMQLRRRHKDEAVWVSLTSDVGGGIVLGGPAGTISIRIEADETATLPAPQTGVYDLELEHTDGTVRRILEGLVRVTPEVTRPEVTP
jgi:hypothetical protein